MFDEGIIVSKKTFDVVDEQEKFKMYYDYRKPVKTIPSHRMLAIRRGESESVLYFLIELEPLRATSLLRARILRGQGTGSRTSSWPLTIPGNASSTPRFRASCVSNSRNAPTR